MPERVFVRERRQGLLDQVFGNLQIQPRRTRTDPNFRADNAEPPRRRPSSRRSGNNVVQPRRALTRRYSSSSDSDSHESPRREPRNNVWRADMTLFQGLGRREPERRAPTPPQETTVLPDGGTRQQDFKFIKMIGEGGQGRCDLYKRTFDNKLFIHKIMKGRVDFQDGKPKEVKITKDILGKHPRLIRMYLHQSTPSKTILFFEYCSGGDLSELIKSYHREHQRPIPESFIWHAYLQLAEAVAFIHTGYDRTDESRPNFQPILHRDIKPQNVFLRKPASSSEYPQVVLADFGLATARTRTDERCGSFMWQGPELPAHSREGDCWSVGACIHAMATGSPPISAAPAGMSKLEWIRDPRSRKTGDIRVHGYSGELVNAVYKVLRTSPSDRLIGRELVKRIERGEDDWHGRRIPLAPWALKS